MTERVVGRVAEIWRYPVKSMLGEKLARAEVSRQGIADDRRFALLDIATGAIVSAKRISEMFGFQARVSDAGLVGIEFPSGYMTAIGAPLLDERLSKLLGRQVRVVDRKDEPVTVQILRGETADSTEGEGFFSTDEGFFDSSPFHVLTTAALGRGRSLEPEAEWDVRRFRPNVLIDGAAPESFEPGTRLEIGEDLRIEITKPCSRCVMTTHALDELPQDRRILATLAKQLGSNLGDLARIAEPGAISEGDAVRVLG